MKLYVSKGDVESLKILITALECDTKLDLIFGNEEEQDFLPCLVKEGLKLFLSTPACVYLHEECCAKKEKVSQSILDFLSNGDFKVNKIENLLHNSEHLFKGKSVADTIVWAEFFGQSRSNKAFVDSLGPRTKLWYDNLSQSASFQSAICQIFDDQKLAIISPQKEEIVSEEQVLTALKAWNSPLKLVSSSKKDDEIVLPVDGEKNILITSALPYVNNVPHLGNIVGAVLSADVFARFCRLRGHNTLYICGTDEYGTTTETKAIEEGMTPQQICDKYNGLHAEIYAWFDIQFDKFGRTTTEKQTEVAQEIFWQLEKEGNLKQDSMDQLYCVSCARFLADRFVQGTCPMCKYKDARGDQCDSCGKLINAVDLIDARCKLCEASPEVKTSRHIFINLPKIQDRLEKWLEKSSLNWTNNARVIAKSWLKGGLQPRCITRDLKWGTKVPMKGYEDKVFYVWFDAPIGYISITANYTQQWEKWWKNPQQVKHYEFMAKDNVPFHSVVFPATLLGTGQKWTMVDHLVSTEYLNYEDDKFSKSRGIGVFGSDAKETNIPADIWRFYLMYTRPESSDSAFKWEDLMWKNNTELLANLGNFVNRALKFCKDNFARKVSQMNLVKDDEYFLAQVNKSLNTYVELMDGCREREAVRVILNISRLGNQLMQAEKPWKLVKSGKQEDLERAGTVVGLCVNLSCLLAVLVEPFMPNLSRVMLEQLNAKMEHVNLLGGQQDNLFHCCLKAGHTIGNPEPLIREIKMEEINSLKIRFAGRSSKKSPQPKKVNDVSVEKLECQVAAQGDAVRKLKEAKADKQDIKAEVEKLLELKKLLALAQGKDVTEAVAAPSKSGKGKKGKKT